MSNLHLIQPGAAGFTTDLHNFAFLGKDPYVGAASDWVWFNVPHGPQKQINSFISVLQACRKGKEKVFCFPPIGCLASADWNSLKTP